MNATTKTHQFFRAIMILSRGRYFTPTELSEEMKIDIRTAYRYIADLEDSPFFELQRRGRRLRLSAESVFWRNVTNSLFLTDKEAVALGEFIDKLDTPNETLEGIQRKVKGLVGNALALDVKDADSILAHNIAEVKTAIENHRMCLLRGYGSLHSDTKNDRLVEPFAFLGSKNDVRCYELASQTNKTFKISRCESVEVLDVEWQFEKKHRQMFTDIFHFSDETTTRVRLLLNNRAKTILLEEVPESQSFVIPQADGRWLLDAEFCSMKGISRFYLGLFEDIEIVESPEFVHFLTNRIEELTELGKSLTLAAKD